MGGVASRAPCHFDASTALARRFFHLRLGTTCDGSLRHARRTPSEKQTHRSSERGPLEEALCVGRHRAFRDGQRWSTFPYFLSALLCRRAISRSIPCPCPYPRPCVIGTRLCCGV